mmetsp:Transcript_28087/g.48708  ORF Transcript_28087/g.48708 Transcript_28087/m.48708 type:complete len:95 (+) Transcript_28087:108-392(+)
MSSFQQQDVVSSRSVARGNWSLLVPWQKVQKRLGAIAKITHMLDDNAKIMAYKALVISRKRPSTGTLSGEGLLKGLYLDRLGRIQNNSQCCLDA